jgi:hypothetical protein
MGLVGHNFLQILPILGVVFVVINNAALGNVWLRAHRLWRWALREIFKAKCDIKRRLQNKLAAGTHRQCGDSGFSVFWRISCGHRSKRAGSWLRQIASKSVIRDERYDPANHLAPNETHCSATNLERRLRLRSPGQSPRGDCANLALRCSTYSGRDFPTQLRSTRQMPPAL